MSYYGDSTRCERCGVRSKLWTIYSWLPERRQTWGTFEHVWPAATIGRTQCLDGRACRARVEKRDARRRDRGRMIVLAEPKAPDAPRGTCRWCGEVIADPLAAKRGRLYHRREDGEPDCKGESLRSRVWTARDALRWVGRRDGQLACVDCGVVVERDGRELIASPGWEADHDVALEDGGAHELANLRCRCTPCHRAKTSAENVGRARERRDARTAQLRLDA